MAHPSTRVVLFTRVLSPVIRSKFAVLRCRGFIASSKPPQIVPWKFGAGIVAMLTSMSSYLKSLSTVYESGLAMSTSLIANNL